IPQMHYHYLSRCTGDSKYRKVSDRITDFWYNASKRDNAPPACMIYVETGQPEDNSRTLFFKASTFYSYLVKSLIHSGEDDSKLDHLVREYLNRIISYEMVTTTSGLYHARNM